MSLARRAARPPAAAQHADPARTLAFLADLSQAFAVSLDLRKTLPEALKRVADFMQAEGASLFLLEPSTRVLECRICVGPVDMTGVRLAIGQGVVGLAVSDNATQLVADAANDPRVWRAGDDLIGDQLIQAQAEHAGAFPRDEHRRRGQEGPIQVLVLAQTIEECRARRGFGPVGLREIGGVDQLQAGTIASDLKAAAGALTRTPFDEAIGVGPARPSMPVTVHSYQRMPSTASTTPIVVA